MAQNHVSADVVIITGSSSFPVGAYADRAGNSGSAVAQASVPMTVSTMSIKSTGGSQASVGTGGIVGIAVGGFAAICLVLLAFFMWVSHLQHACDHWLYSLNQASFKDMFICRHARSPH